MPDPTRPPHIAVTFDGDTHWLACFAAKPDSDLGDTIYPIAAGDAWDILATKAREHLLNCPVASIQPSEARRQAVDAALTELLARAGQVHEVLDRIGDLAYRANPHDPDAAAAALTQIHKMAKEANR